MKRSVLKVLTLLFAVGVVTALTVHSAISIGCRTPKETTKTNEIQNKVLPQGGSTFGNLPPPRIPKPRATQPVHLDKLRFLPASKAAPLLSPWRRRLGTRNRQRARTRNVERRQSLPSQQAVPQQKSLP